MIFCSSGLKPDELLPWRSVRRPSSFVVLRRPSSFVVVHNSRKKCFFSFNSQPISIPFDSFGRASHRASNYIQFFERLIIKEVMATFQKKWKNGKTGEALLIFFFEIGQLCALHSPGPSNQLFGVKF